MNGNKYNHDPFYGSYTVNDRIYRNNCSTTANQNPTNTYYRHSYSQPAHEHIQIQQKRQPNTVNQRHLYMINLQQQQRERSNLDIYNFEKGGLASSTSYYDRIHAQFRSNTSLNQPQNSTFKQSRETSPIMTNGQSQQNLSVAPPNKPIRRSPIMTNGQSQQNFLVTSTNKPLRTSPQPQSRISNATLVIDNSSSNLLRNDDDDDDDLPLDYLYYTMDSLIQRLVPTDTYIPKQSFIYPMLLCSRTHIPPNLLLNKLARLTINSITSLTRDRNIRIMNNFLCILSQWTRTFPYDFRNTEMISQLEEILRQIDFYEPTLKSDTYHINKKLRSKLQALEDYEEYIRQLNKKALNSVSQMALLTDIINECPTTILFAQQLTHIELDRLKPIGAEELIQYFIMKLASEEARAHPNRTFDNSKNNKLSNIVHDKKLTFCLETYIQWFNRLTFFVTTEIVKHTQKRLRMRLINYFIDAAYECFRLRNFNSMIGIIGGLNMQPVKRLKRTWEKIQLDKLAHLEQYTDVSKNFSNYRHKLKEIMNDSIIHKWTIDKIVIPFTSIVLQDVYYIKTHSKDYTIEDGINLKKYYSMAKTIYEEFVQCKQSKCSFQRNDVIINYIITSPTFNEDDLMRASFECEPPVSANEKEKWTMLQASVNISS